MNEVKKYDYDYFRYRTQQAIRELEARVNELEERLNDLCKGQ